MSEEFNIFKNLEDLKKTNLLDQLKSLEPSETTDLNDSQGLENDDFDFDAIVNKKDVKKSPTKRHLDNEKSTTSEKKSKKKTKSRRKSTSSDGSLSPTMPFLENLSRKGKEVPVSRRTRRSLGAQEQTEQEDFESLYPPNPKYGESGKGKGSKRRSRGRGGGRGRNNQRQFIRINNPTDFSANSHSSSTSQMSSNEVSAQASDASDQPSLASRIMEHFLQQDNRGNSRVMRARRRYIAEIAARSTQVDYVDLVSSPMPRVEGFVDLDLYEEVEQQRTTRSKNKKQVELALKSKKSGGSTNPSLDISYEEDNPELNIKVNWKGKPEAFKLRKHQKFCMIFEQLAKRENIDVENIVFNLNERIISADDTPDSINYKVFHFIDGRVLSNSFTTARAAAPVTKKRDANKITLKVQSDQWKRPLQIDMMKSEKFRILYIKCAEELKVAVDELKLSFDGDLLELNGTPMDLDLEGGEAIDLRIKK